MKLTPSQMKQAIAEVHVLIAQSDIPGFITDQITDDRITQGITQVLAAVTVEPTP